MSRYIDNTTHLNISEMFEKTPRVTRVEMTAAERSQFFSKHIKPMQMSLAPNRDLILEFKNENQKGTPIPNTA